MRLRTIQYLRAFLLFEHKKYEDSMDLFSSVSATPRSIIKLFPSSISGELAIVEESEDQHSTTTSNDVEENSVGRPSPAVARAIPESVRSSLDSPRRLKDGESDSGSITSKHTEIAQPGPPGIRAHDTY